MKIKMKLKKSTKILVGAIILFGVIYAIQRLSFTTSTTENANPFAKLDTSKINRISITGAVGEREIIIARESRGWFIVSPIRFEADRSEINLLLSAIAGNPPASVVADNLSDSLAYGLGEDAPSLGISENIQNGISLRVGSVTPDFDGCYIELKGSTRILDLTKNIRTYVSQSLTNWRDRAIFEFRLEDIREAIFNLGDTTYHFTHVDTGWQMERVNIPAARIREVIGDFMGTMALSFVDTALSMEKSSMDYEFIIANGSRQSGKLMKESDQTYVSNSANDQTYVAGSLILDNLERGLREISRDFLKNGNSKR